MEISMITKSARLIANKSLLLAQKYAPDIMTAGGVAAIGVGTVMACKATLKLPDILDEANTRLDKIDYHYDMLSKTDTTDLTTKYDPMDMKRDKLATFADAGKKLVKLYGPSAITIVAGISCVLGAHGMMKKRNAGLVMAYNGVQSMFDKYRERVIDDAGEAKDFFYRTGTEKQDIQAFDSTDDENGKKIKGADVINPIDEHSEYARIFDECNPNWSKDPGMNLVFLRNTQSYLNDKFHAKGYMFLNDVYDALGFDRTPQGQLVGWIIEDGDDTNKYVDFGIYDKLYENVAKRDFINAAEPCVWLDFNVDGVVYNMI